MRRFSSNNTHEPLPRFANAPQYPLLPSHCLSVYSCSNAVKNRAAPRQEFFVLAKDTKIREMAAVCVCFKSVYCWPHTAYRHMYVITEGAATCVQLLACRSSLSTQLHVSEPVTGKYIPNSHPTTDNRGHHSRTRHLHHVFTMFLFGCRRNECPDSEHPNVVAKTPLLLLAREPINCHTYGASTESFCQLRRGQAHGSRRSSSHRWMQRGR